MRLVRSLAVGFGIGAVTLLSASPALALDTPQVVAAQPSTPAAPAPATTVTQKPTVAPAPPVTRAPQVGVRPSGGVQTGGGPVEDNSVLLLGGAGAVVALGVGGVVLRRRAAGKAN